MLFETIAFNSSIWENTYEIARTQLSKRSSLNIPVSANFLLLFLGFIFDYSLYEEVQRFPSYYTADVDLYSLDDLIQLRFGSGLPYKVKDIVIKGIHHILNCEV